MKKAVISTGGKQYLVSENEIIDIELVTADKQIVFKPLLIINDDKIDVGKPIIESASVKATIVEANKKADKVTAIRYKAKKRVHKVHGHRQHLSQIKITSITV